MAVSLSRRTGAVAFFYWVWDGLDRTIFTAIKFSFPARFVSPFGFLGMLTFIVFVILGVSGALLMFYYQPILDRAWDSVAFINNEVPFGFHIRNIHYHGSNAMVLLAVLHMYYQYFSGRYKIRNEILWVTGVILGTVTILEAFTGYDIIFSERAELAISIAASLTNSIPVAGPIIRDAMFGSGFSDFVLRFYAQHVFILPLVMLGLMAVHFPRFLVFDVPMVFAIGGAIMLTGGVFPIDLGFKFQPNVPPGITVPEWYLTGLYAFLRTQYDKFVTGVLWPGLFIASLLLVPFLDRYKKFSWKDRPMITAFGITGIAQIMVTTYWGFYIPADTTLALVDRLVIDPVFLYLVMILLVPMSFGFTYMMIKLAKEAERKAKIAKEKGPKQVSTIRLSQQWINWLIVALLAFQVFLNIAAYNAALTGMNNIELFLVGLIMITFAGFFHLYRYSMNESKKAPPPPPPPKADMPQLTEVASVPEVESKETIPEKPPTTK
ncbi:MAG: cytochrome bc complex cytochrome b subunit [Cenarchaeum sp. SB0665_bin_23]|nr:cytochrome bc complex cytochrome b subunit [Cenarchaeum sp. SB0667_bin_13]MXY60514.1 cytochrome bc complex cytochrome b subunit [Cenarchaeum sp. SB0665_bin_23]MXZ93270.1 cytochrome bc complex cytochrome b subunit [Cenarchaeum sp. SB0666_bin_15]MYB47480.1 cytochrome bc complex cytochrome b subunit [Cenarchaeum sp. SB0662_bin_33]MYC79317.1 cytochrome bc complex cytochrome b subunit [Cenarchaeum sp. SB0661_bin_35]MYD58044.1 cytochrome bc complex cytochrome b subunit [Cenarchaeum sp. SB0678_bin